MDEQTNEREIYVQNLHNQLQTLIAGQSFDKTDAGALIIKILEADVTRFTNEILSNKFTNDHQGYVDVRAKANYAASLLGRLKALDAPEKEKEIREQIKAIADEDKIGTTDV